MKDLGGEVLRLVEVVGANIHSADFERSNDTRLHRDHIFLVLKLAIH
jgi:hypothetical protein